MIQGIYPPNDTDSQTDATVFYLERMMDLWEKGYSLMAQDLFSRYQSPFAALLPAEPYRYLAEKALQERPWSPKIEQDYYGRLKNAILFGEWQTVHDCAHEILLSRKIHPNPDDPLYRKVLLYLAQNNFRYIEPNEIQVNTYIDAPVGFVVENGNPGFRLHDAVGGVYRCFIKDVTDAKVGDVLPLKITNIPGFEINSHHRKETILYVEPRVSPGDFIEVEIASLSHSGNSFTFRHRSYDGFLWIKKRGVNKQQFNPGNLRPKDRVIAKVLYTSDEVKLTAHGSPCRLGLIKAIPIRRMTENSAKEPSQRAMN
ncbi:MAG: hypothetical protein RBU29_08150 [bacterium]|nr:hypothetical protein [bacterium]